MKNSTKDTCHTNECEICLRDFRDTGQIDYPRKRKSQVSSHEKRRAEISAVATSAERDARGKNFQQSYDQQKNHQAPFVLNKLLQQARLNKEFRSEVGKGLDRFISLSEKRRKKDQQDA